MKKRGLFLLVVVITLLFGTVFSSAATDPAVTIVSPGATVYGNSLLISIKITEPKTMKVYLYEEKEKIGDTFASIKPSIDMSLDGKTVQSFSVMTPVTYQNTGTLQFFNKQVSNLKEGLYRIKVDTLTATGSVAASSSSRVIVMENAPTSSSEAIFRSGSSGAFQWVQNLLKSLFGN